MLFRARVGARSRRVPQRDHCDDYHVVQRGRQVLRNCRSGALI